MSLRLDDQLCFALYAATHAMHRAYREPLKGLGVTYSQYLVLLVLWEEDMQTVSQIGARLFLDSATLTPLLKRLESQGLVDRRRSVADERSVLIGLTEAGEALKRRARGVRRAIGMAVCQPEEEMRALLVRLQSLRADLDRHDAALCA